MNVDLESLPCDPRLRPNITSYTPDLIKQILRVYLLKGPYQPHEHDFPQILDENQKCKFVAFGLMNSRVC